MRWEKVEGCGKRSAPHVIRVILVDEPPRKGKIKTVFWYPDYRSQAYVHSWSVGCIAAFEDYAAFMGSHEDAHRFLNFAKKKASISAY